MSEENVEIRIVAEKTRKAMGAREPRQMDPNNEQIHRVLTTRLELYKQKAVPRVRAECGKVWAPTLPFTGRMREMPKCPVCFPAEENRFSIAV